MKNLTLIIFIFLFGGSKIQAQQAVDVSGGDAAGSGGTVSYSVGQAIYTTNTGSSGSEAQGVQQPYEISVVLGIEEADDITLLLSIYPVPATDFVILKVENYDSELFTYQLYDVNGKIYESGTLVNNETKIDMGKLPAAVFFLKVANDNKEIKTFKIVKN